MNPHRPDQWNTASDPYANQYTGYPAQPAPPGPQGHFPSGPGGGAYGPQGGYSQPGQYNAQLPPSTAGAQYHNHVSPQPPYADPRQFGGPPMPNAGPSAPPHSNYGQGYNQGYGQGMEGQPYMPGSAGKAPPPQPSQPFSIMNPWSMLSSVSQMGQNVQASQQYVSSQVSWFTGGFFQQLFQVDPNYVGKKVFLLLAPFLRKYSYVRQYDNMAANVPVMKPPREDIFAPDLYVPLFSMCTYVVLAACNKFANGAFTPDVMYSMVSWAALAWSLNFFVIWLLVRMMMLGVPPPSLDLLAYSGYSFFSFCLTTLCGWAFGSGLGWHIAWLYTSTCMSVFLIRTFKQIMRIDAANRGEANVGRHRMYLLLGMGAAQFVVSWIMGATVHVKPVTE